MLFRSPFPLLLGAQTPRTACQGGSHPLPAVAGPVVAAVAAASEDEAGVDQQVAMPQPDAAAWPLQMAPAVVKAAEMRLQPEVVVAIEGAEAAA